MSAPVIWAILCALGFLAALIRNYHVEGQLQDALIAQWRAEDERDGYMRYAQKAAVELDQLRAASNVVPMRRGTK